MSKKEDQRTTKSRKEESDSRLFALLGMIPLLGYIIVMFARKDDKYSVFYAKQGMVVFLVWIGIKIIALIFINIPLLGKTLLLVLLVLWILGVVNSLSGEETETPIIGKLGRKL
ncbi:MAG: hypothetical protein ACP5NW_01590 [Candidatus Woesearchaeota archaeon]